MRGVSEGRLRGMVERYCDPRVKAEIQYLIEYECKELNLWLPIDENTPKDGTPLLLRADCGTVIEGSFVNDLAGGYWINHYHHDEIIPTHYQELPDYPKE